ncbi:O-antigen ligase family protein [Luteimonas cucumeris]|nr:O-antigen ligase family protein [Luteimonas cucumeris]
MAATIPVTDTSTISIRLRCLALAALCFHAFFAMTGFGGQLKPEYGAMLALLLMLASGATPWRELAKQPAARLLAVSTLFVVVHAGYATQVFPSIGYSKQLSAAAELVRLGVFSCVIGWWLSLMPRAIPVLLGLMVAGLLIAIATRMPWADLPLIWSGQYRPKFGLPENLSGQLAALASWLSFCLLLVVWDARSRVRWRGALLAACLLGYAGSFSALLFSQSRGAWLAFVAMLPLTAVALGYARRRNRKTAMPWAPWAPLASVVALSLLLTLGANGIVAKRFAGAQELLPDIATTDEGTAETEAPLSKPAAKSAPTDPAPKPTDATNKAKEINNTAVSVRMELYDLGVERWQQRPLLGWGLRSTSALIAGSGLDLSGQRHAHLHSAYLDALVGMGAIGAVLFGLLFVLLLRELILAWRSGTVSDAGFWTLAGSIGIVLVANGFDSLLWRHAHARAPLEIIFGCCVAYGLIRRRRAAVD